MLIRSWLTTKGVLAPVFDVDQGVVQRRAIVARKGIDTAQGAGGGKHVGGDDIAQQTGKFAIRQVDAVEGFKLLTKIALQRGAVSDVGTVFVFEALKFADEAVFDLLLFDDVIRCAGRQAVVEFV